ncbi:MAG: LamG domain-containing protein, partial [Actinomycetota bacterium]|nr:LamG domain-containing protein [Actinomycetota bacterium]
LTWVRIMGGTTSANVGVFYGQVSIEGWRLGASQFSGNVDVSVDAIDMFEQLANTGTPSSVYAIEVKADTPRAWYRLGESSGTVATDSSGNGYHGTYEGGATFNARAGLVDNDPDGAIGFDGVDDYVVVPPAAVTSLTSATSVAVWFEVADGAVIASSQSLFSAAPTTTHRLFLILKTDGKLQFSANTGSASSAADSTAAYNDGSEHFAVGTWNGTDTVSLYVDGVLVSSDNSMAPTQSDGNAGPGVRIGSSFAGTTTSLLAGTLDEVTVYDTALSAARVLAHYNAGTNPWASELTSARITHILDAIAFPATLRTIGTGQSSMPAASLNTDALSALLDVNKAERGELYIDHADGGKLRFRGRHARWTEARSITSQATFGDSGAEVTYSAIDIQDDRIVNNAVVQRFGGANVTARDSASETQYQIRSYSETGLLLLTDAEVESRANAIVAEKKDRHRRVRSITLEPRKSTHSAWAQVFARAIGDRITVKWRPPYGGTYTYDSYIIGISHRWTPGSGLRTTFALEPVPYAATGAPYFIWDTSTWDSGTSSTRWGF